METQGLGLGPQTMAVDAVIVREELCLRKPDAQLVERYVESIESIRENAPIEVNQDNVLVDGHHRLLAHRSKGLVDIPYKVIETASDDHLLELAIVANAKHGKQLSAAEKKRLAIRLYQRASNKKERTATRKKLKTLLAVSDGCLSNWLSGHEKAAKEEEEAQIWDLHLACYTQDEIAERMGGFDTSTITKRIQDLVKNFNSEKIHKDFEPKLYDVWRWSKADTDGPNHKGQSHSGIVENLVYAYTEPLDVIVDPFAGSGSTMDVCKRHGRRYFISDLNPIPSREKLIRRHDILDGPPQLPQGYWSDVKLLYLDPPYWKQAKGFYDGSASDLSTIEDADEFHDVLARFIGECAARMTAGSYIALLMRPTQWQQADRSRPVFHARAIDRRVDTEGGPCRLVDMFSCPYGTEQYDAMQVAHAKEHRLFMKLTRSLTLWEVVPRRAAAA